MSNVNISDPFHLMLSHVSTITPLSLLLGSLSKPRRRRQQERHQTKG